MELGKKEMLIPVGSEDKLEEMSGSDFNPNNCPVGIVNEKNIENLGDRFDMAIERLTEKVTEMKEDITSLSRNMDKNFNTMESKFEGVDRRFDSMEDKFDKKINNLKDSIPDIIDSRIENRKDHTARSILTWIFTGAGATIIISIATAWIRSKLGI